MTRIVAVLVAALLGWQERPRPNLIIILADDLGYADVGFNGCKDIPTPHIDSIARNGMRFASGYVSHPFCSPTRAGLLAGRYQQRFGHENNPKYDPNDAKLGLPAGEITIAQVLREAGYVTGAVGKWHLGAAPGLHPNARGFDDYFGLIGGGHQYMPVPRGAAEYTIPIQRNREPVEEREYLTDALGREAEAFVERHAAKPFFLYLAFNAPHTPLQATEKYLARFAGIADPKRRSYAAMVSAMDDAVGRLLEALRARKLEEKTLVFFLSDNGGPIEPNASSNGPLRGKKGQLYEGGIHVPFAAQWRGTLPEGGVFEAQVCSIDLFATCAAASGAKVPRDRRMDGVDLLPFVLGRKEGVPHDRLFWRTGGGQSFAVRQGDFKLVRSGDGQPQLFDLRADPGELRDLASERPGIAMELSAALAAWNAELVPPLFENPRPAPAPSRKPPR